MGSIPNQGCIFCFFTPIVLVCFSSEKMHLGFTLEICNSQHLCFGKMSQSDPLLQKVGNLQPLAPYRIRTIFYRIYGLIVP